MKLAIRTAAFVLALWAAIAVPAGAQQGDGSWLRAETASFVVFSRARESQVLEIAQAMEDFDATLRRLTALNAPPSETKVQIYIVRDTDELRDAVPGVSFRIGGLYHGGQEEISAFVIYNEGYFFEPIEIAFHEYAHHFMLHYFPNAYPRWYVEGWAEFVSTTRIEGRVARVGRPAGDRVAWLRAEGLLEPEHFLAPERMRRRSDDFSARYYAHSWLAALFIANRPEREQGLRNYVRALGDGADVVAAFEPAFGLTPEAFNTELRDYLRGNNTPVRVMQLSPEPPTVAITRMPRSADDLLLRVAGDRAGASGGAANILAGALNRYSSGFPGDPYALKARARAGMLRERYTDARTILDGVIAGNGQDVEALFLAAYTHVAEVSDTEPGAARDAGLRAARRYLAQGFRADANHYPTLYLYALTFAMTDEPLEQAQLEVLARAVELAPNVRLIRFLFADELLQVGHFETAITVLRPLMYLPHDEAVSARVRTMIEYARRGEVPPPADEEGAASSN